MNCRFCKQKAKYEIETILGWWVVCLRHKNKYINNVCVRRINKLEKK
jgi:hypothetical protein